MSTECWGENEVLLHCSQTLIWNKLLDLFVVMKIKITLLLFAFNFINLYSQIDQTSILFKELKTRDSLLFNVGYNTCDLNQFESLLDDDFEFYHDEAGLINSKSAFILSVKKRICNSSLKPSRELEENSLQVYKLEKNGQL